MTPRQKQVYDALTDEFQPAHTIARLAALTNMHREEAAAKYCIQLTKGGWAERRGTRMFPEWRRAPRVLTGTTVG